VLSSVVPELPSVFFVSVCFFCVCLCVLLCLCVEGFELSPLVPVFVLLLLTSLCFVFALLSVSVFCSFMVFFLFSHKAEQ